MLLASTRRQIKTVSTSKYARSKKVWSGVAVVILLTVFWAVPAFAGTAPGAIGYSIKRGEETAASNLAPLSSWRSALRLRFANDRVAEAAYVANHANQHGDKDQTKAAATITSLLDTYENTYVARTAVLNQGLNKGQKLSKADAQSALRAVVGAYTTLQLLRLQAPDSAQLAVLTAVDDVQKNIAVLSDAQGAVPLSESDFAQLAKLVPLGIISQSNVDALANVRSNRALQVKLESLIEDGQLPSDISYILDLDLVKKIAPSKAATYETVAQFGQLQRISAVLTASRPTSTQQKAIKEFVANYKAGQVIPKNGIYQYVIPIVDGMALSGQLQTNLPNLNAIHMSGDDQVLYDRWKSVLDPPNLSETYQKLITSASGQPALHLRNLLRIQAELTAAQKAQVAYLVMPPGWNSSQLETLDKQMSTEIAETAYQQSKPNTGQELARLAITQAQLQKALDNLKATYNDNSTKLQTQINNFNGTPDQLAELKNDLASLTKSQTTTINNLQTQLIDITNTSTTLGRSIQDLRQEQITNLTELELRAAADAQQLTDSATAQLTTSLNQINVTSQTLITNLQDRVDALGTGQTSLREELTAEIQTVQNNYTQLAAYTQAQLDTGLAASAQLQTELQAVQINLSQHTAQLDALSSGNNALTQLVNQVKTDSTAQASGLQDQIDGLKIGQQTVQASLSSLQDKQAADVAQLSGQLGSLSVLQAEVQATVAGLADAQAQAQTDIDNLTTDFRSLQTAFDTSLQTQTAIQVNIVDQQSELSSLQTQIQSGLDSLAQQQSQLSGQLDNLAASTTSLSRVIDGVQATASTTQTQLDTLLANPPWALATGAYVTQDQLDSLSAQLDTQFAQKAAEIDAQFQAYQAQLNTSINQVNSELNTLTTEIESKHNTHLSNHTVQQEQIDLLNAQIQILETQLQQLAAPPPTP